MKLVLTSTPIPAALLCALACIESTSTAQAGSPARTRVVAQFNDGSFLLSNGRVVRRRAAAVRVGVRRNEVLRAQLFREQRLRLQAERAFFRAQAGRVQARRVGLRNALVTSAIIGGRTGRRLARGALAASLLGF